MHYGKNGPWHKNIAIGLLMYSFSLVPASILLMKHIQVPGLPLALVGISILGTAIILRSVTYNFSRMKHCAKLSRDNDEIFSAGVIELPEYLRRQMLLAAEIQRLDSLTKP